MTCATSDITILKGTTFARTLRWESAPLVYKAITGITKAAPVVITATGHGLVDGWRAAVLSAGGMREINATVRVKGQVPAADQFRKVTYVDANSIAFNEVNSLDFTAYTSGGALVYYTPVDLAGFTARMQIRATANATGDPLVSLTTENGGITIDNTAKTIDLLIAATATAALDFVSGVYDLEMISAGGVVTQLVAGKVLVQEEVTR